MSSCCWRLTSSSSSPSSSNLNFLLLLALSSLQISDSTPDGAKTRTSFRSARGALASGARAGGAFGGGAIGGVAFVGSAFGGGGTLGGDASRGGGAASYFFDPMVNEAGAEGEFHDQGDNLKKEYY
jgi:hypothetical protein